MYRLSLASHCLIDKEDEILKMYIVSIVMMPGSILTPIFSLITSTVYDITIKIINEELIFFYFY